MRELSRHSRRHPVSMMILLLALGAPVVHAQDTPPEPPQETPADPTDQIQSLRDSLADLDARNAELQAHLAAAQINGDQQAEQLRVLQQELEAQRKLIADQLKQLESQKEELDAQDQRLADLETMVVSLNNRLLEMQDQLPDSTLNMALEERLARLETSVDDLPELPSEVVGAGEFPGSFQIPGTDAQLKIGGRVKTALVYNLTALAVDDRFLTAAIPIKGTSEAGKGSRLTMSARSSRFNLDLRTPTGVGHVRAFIEGDFAGEGNSLRMRHAYGQYNHYLFGQTWSALADLEAMPEELDFEGLNAIIRPRKTQIRGNFPLGDKHITVSIEDPSPAVTDAVGISLIPDIVAATGWEFGLGHVSAGAIFRQIKAEPLEEINSTYTRAGWGLSITGKIKVGGEENRDDVRFQFALGQGLGSYIADLRAEGGQDAIFDTETNVLHTLPVLATYVSYSHWWKETNFRSTACFGFVNVSNHNIQASDAYRRTYRLSVNLIYTPAPRMDVGIELLGGRRENKDLQHGTARQIQLAGIFRF